MTVIQESDLRLLIDRACQGRGGQRSFANEVGVSEGTMSAVRHGVRRIPAKIAVALGYQPVLMYAPIGSRSEVTELRSLMNARRNITRRSRP